MSNKTNIVTYEHVNFYADAVVKQTEAEFIKHESHHGLNEAQLKEAYKFCVERMKPEPKKAEAVK